jgi:hypothetical protein
MATLAAPTLEGVTEAVGVGSTAQKKFKQYLAKFVSDDVEIEDDEASRSDSESEQELESPDRQIGKGGEHEKGEAEQERERAWWREEWSLAAE